MIGICILSGCALFGGGQVQGTPPQNQPAYTGPLLPGALSREGFPEAAGHGAETGKAGDEESLENPESPQPLLPLGEEPGRGERIMKALARAYPDRLGPAEYRDGDWAVPIRGEWYYYAEGRLLPEELRSKAAQYDPQPFYRYPAELPPWHDPDPEESARFREQAARRARQPPKRSQHFYDALWRARNRDESYDRVKSMRFLGKSLMVHYAILEELSLVEEKILSEAKTDPQVRQWISRISTLEAWNWRNIADTQSRSFHSYGAAVDILPSSTGKLETYWLWTARTKSDWWTVPYEQRFHPPEAVVKAFESYGFAWGGKWLFYDTMHFEYRPELFILNDIPLTGLR
ncbi:MAG: M15 family metallopeptidase [Treponema sp.]|nr:M15 family metallopeptidase [Treponema sp.]